jgi:outer membrane protein OmpA-like peptidoglycan-associated protein
MTPLFSKAGSSSWDKPKSIESESFWISYSDLMAGLLMIFALTTVFTVFEINYRLNQPTKVLEEWKEVVDAIRNDEELMQIDSVQINDVGALIINNEHLRFTFGNSTLGEMGKQILRKAVPKYLNVIKRHPKFIQRISVIEISGHTDSKDAGGANPTLSRERAGKVLTFLSREKAMFPHFDLIRTKAVTAGYADTRLPESCKGREMCDEARRVEITIRLDETNILKEFQKILVK